MNWVIVNGVLQFNGTLTVAGLSTESLSTGSSNQTVAAGQSTYVPSQYEVANGFSLTIENTGILEVG